MVVAPDDLSDGSRPHPERVYSYLLGRFHNWEVDRQAGEQIVKLLPFARQYARLQRHCLQKLAQDLTEEGGYDVIIDFASGLPTEYHLHHYVKPGTVVIYSDWDPIMVACGRDMLQKEGARNTFYVEANAGIPERLLDDVSVNKALKGRRNVVLVHWGISAFMRDEALAHGAHVLHEWAGPKACWVFNAQWTDILMDDKQAQVCEMYQQMGAPLYVRRLEQYKQLLKPWKPDEKGFFSLIDRLGYDIKNLMSDDEIQSWGKAGGAYGACLVR